MSRIVPAPGETVWIIEEDSTRSPATYLRPTMYPFVLVQDDERRRVIHPGNVVLSSGVCMNGREA